jgi:BTB/POZ domain-containing protein KCTD9
MKLQHLLVWPQFLWAGFLAAFKLEKHLRLVFPEKIWKKKRLSTQNSTKRILRLILGFPIVLYVAVVSEKQLTPSSSPPPLEGKPPELVIKPMEVTLCNTNDSWHRFYCLLTNSQLLKLFETFAIAIGLVIYLFDRGERRDRSIREDWMLIDGARGAETSGARYSAIERLHREKVSLRGLDAPLADLRRINLEEAILEGSNLRGAQLDKAILERANLRESNLQDVKLKESNLQDIELHLSDLRGSNLEGSNLKRAWLGAAKLHRAILRSVDFSEADLRGARFHSTVISRSIFRKVLLQQAIFEDVDFTDISLVECNLNGTKFKHCRGLTIESLKLSHNWKLAEFDDFTLPDCDELSRISKYPDYFQSHHNDNAVYVLRLFDQIQEIENLIDKIRSRKYKSISEIQEQQSIDGIYIEEFSSLRDLLFRLEDIEDEKKNYYDNLIDSICSKIDESSEQED